MGGTGTNETEIKLRLDGHESVEKRLASIGFRVTKPRVFEANTVFDDMKGRIRGRGCLLRLRQVGGRALLTFKGPSERTRHKSREELETTLGDAQTGALIFERLGFQPIFRYEKYRTEYERPGEHGIVTVDETPIGWFLELEGEPAWIDQTAAELGFEEKHYLTDSYGSLYLMHCKQTNVEPSNMLFASLP